MSYHGDIRLGDTIDIKFTTRRFSTGAPFTLAGSPAVAAYVGNGTTEITSGITLTVDFDSRTGLNNVRIVATSGNGFAAATNVQLVITAGTVDSVSVVGEVVGEFSIENRSALMPTVAGRTLDVSSGGEAGLDWANIGSPTSAQTLSGTATRALEPTSLGRSLDVTATGEAGIDWANIGSPTTTQNLSGTSTKALEPTVATRTLDVSIGGEAGLDWGNIGNPTSAQTLSGTSTKAVEPTVAGRTLDVSAGGEAGVDWANVGGQSTAVNLSATTVNAVTTVGSVSGAVGSVTGNVGGIVVGSVGSVAGNVSGNVVGSVGSVATNGISRASLAADTGLQTIRSNTAQAGAATSITLDASASATNDFYNQCRIYLTGGVGAGQSRKILDYVGASKVATVRAWVTTPDNTTTFAILPEDSVWDDILADHLTAGSTGAALNAAGSAGDPWNTSLPGAYGAGTAGFIVGTNLDAQVSTRLAPTVAGRTLDVSTGGEAGLDWSNIGAPASTQSLANTEIQTVAGNVGGNVNGNIIGSMLGSVVGNVGGSIGSVGAGGISASSIANGALTDAKFNFPAEAAGIPTTFMAVCRRIWEMLDGIAKRRRLTETDQLVDAMLASAMAEMPTPLRRRMLLAYLGYPFYDTVTLPLLRGEGLTEFDPVKVDRISPDDARSIRSGGTSATLRGVEFYNFGAFFSRAYRENDYLWGRLHGAERMIDLVASTLPDNATLSAEALQDFKREAFLAILQEEEKRLCADTGLINGIRSEIVER